MPDTRIAGTTPEEAGARNAPQEGRISALESRINTLLTGIEKEKRSTEEEKQKQKPEDKPITFGGVQTALDKLMKSIAMALNRVSSSIDGKIRDIGKIYATQDQAKEFAKDAVPPMLRGLGTSGGAEPSTGNVIMVQPGGKGGQDSAFVGTVKAGTTTTIEEVWAFGVKSILVAKVTMYEGYTMKGTQTQGFVAETELNITKQGQIAYLSYSLASGASTWGVSNTFPLSGSGTYVKPMQSFNFVNGVASKLFTYH